MQEIANLFTRDGMVFYPEDTGNKLGEVWHGDKLLCDIPDHLLSPTVDSTTRTQDVQTLRGRRGNPNRAETTADIKTRTALYTVRGVAVSSLGVSISAATRQDKQGKCRLDITHLHQGQEPMRLVEAPCMTPRGSRGPMTRGQNR